MALVSKIAGFHVIDHDISFLSVNLACDFSSYILFEVLVPYMQHASSTVNFRYPCYCLKFFNIFSLFMKNIWFCLPLRKLNFLKGHWLEQRLFVVMVSSFLILLINSFARTDVVKRTREDGGYFST